MQTDLADIDETTVYSQPHAIESITYAEIRKAISQAPPKKAPGGDSISNIVLKSTIEILLPHLQRIFNVCLIKGYCPEHFRNSVTIVLSKPGKDYSIPKEYRLIALLNTLGKAMEFILTRRIVYLAETHNLLPDTYIGGRRLRSCKHRIHYLLKRIY